MRKPIVIVIGLTLFVVASITHADVQPADIFGDRMVLQREAPVPVWGRADPGEAVTVSFRGQTVKTTADDTGAWRVTLPESKAGGPFELTIQGNDTVTFTDVLVGDVWLCSGQSNMAFPLKWCDGWRERESKDVDHPRIRLVTIGNRPSLEPMSRIANGAKWLASDTESADGFSGVGYVFGRAIHKSQNVPVGLIGAYQGATPVEAWTSGKTVEAEPEYKPILERWERYVANYPEAMKRYEKKLAQWEPKAAEARAAGKRPPRKPRRPKGPMDNNRPAVLYNARIAPIAPYAIRGVIWYQGERNSGRAAQYRELFPNLIRDWCARWGQGEFPFLFVQLAVVGRRARQPGDSAWGELREAQALARSLPNTAMVCSYDTAATGNIHPKNKRPVGERLARAARAIVYGEDVAYRGPQFRKMTVRDGEAVLTFDHVGKGLVVKGDALEGFAVASADKTFHWAEARIEGNKVVVSAEAVTEPAAVRYAWANNPPGNLVNKEGLPAEPFRTDEWRLTTEGRVHP